MSTLSKIVAVIGPTASGKTALGVSLCQQFDGEIVSADAKQVYRRMDIGTAKELDLPVPQHLIDIREPGEQIRVADYQVLAYRAIEEIRGRGKLPVLVGGSGLYAESVLNGYVFKEGEKSRVSLPSYASLKLGIEVGREVLKEKADRRLHERVEQGLVGEVQSLLAEGVSPVWLLSCGIEYRYFTLHVMGELSLDEAIAKAEIATHQFIKRQYTWWRRHTDVHWISSAQEAAGLVSDWLADA